MSLTKYMEAARFHFYQSVIYFKDALGNATVILIIMLVFIYLWRAIFAQSATAVIEGFTYATILWYLVMSESLASGPGIGRLLEDIGEEVQSGSIAYKLTKPYSYLFFSYATVLGRFLVHSLSVFSVSGLLVFFFVGGLSVSLVSVPFIMLAAFLGLTLNIVMVLVLGVVSFWLEDASSLAFIYKKFIFVLGGMLLPLDLFPGWLKAISAKLPFSYVAYGPAKLWVSFSWAFFIEVLLAQLFWIVVLSGVAALLYRLCVHRLTVNGG